MTEMIPPSWFGPIEMILAFGLIVGFCAWEVWKLKKEKRDKGGHF